MRTCDEGDTLYTIQCICREQVREKGERREREGRKKAKVGSEGERKREGGRETHQRYVS